MKNEPEPDLLGNFSCSAGRVASSYVPRNHPPLALWVQEVNSTAGGCSCARATEAWRSGKKKNDPSFPADQDRDECVGGRVR